MYLDHRLLEKVPWVATTADSWSVHNEAYLGMTAHPKTRTGQHAVLIFSPIRGRHTFAVLTQAMVDDVRVKFNIQDKVTTTTDNGSNFVEAFIEFGSESGVVPELPADDSESDSGDNDDDDDDDESDMEAQEVEVLVDEADALRVVSVLVRR